MHEKAAGMRQIVEKCWADEAFKRRLMADPTATLKSMGVPVPQGKAIVVVEDTDSVCNLVIPAKPAALSDDDLASMSGGQDFCTNAKFAGFRDSGFGGIGFVDPVE